MIAVQCSTLRLNSTVKLLSALFLEKMNSEFVFNYYKTTNYCCLCNVLFSSKTMQN